VKFYVLSPQLMAMDDCSFQGGPSLYLNDVTEVMHVRQIHDNVPLEVVESVLMLFSIQLLVNYEIGRVITPIDGYGLLFFYNNIHH
jgi:hypothetical protein